MVLTSDAELIARGYAQIDLEQNKCKSASINLETGDILECVDTNCYLYSQMRADIGNRLSPTNTLYFIISLGILVLIVLFVKMKNNSYFRT